MLEEGFKGLEASLCCCLYVVDWECDRGEGRGGDLHHLDYHKGPIDGDCKVI